ncbi:Glycosyl hydrolase YngK, partial [Pseudolycoriella hygida]
MIRTHTLLLLLVLGYVHAHNISEKWPNREHRGVWIASVENIDWPLTRTSTVREQQNQLKYLIGQIHLARLNAVYFQVRPTGDALYSSSIEPWSRYLTGEEGTPPSPLWDPLRFLIDICRPLSIEVHAWINPYRANLSPHTDNVAANHMARMYPQYAYVYSTYMWMDPGAEVVQNRTTQVALDLVNRYDLDGLHMDDYFYPYPVAGWTFPDDATYAAYLSTGGSMDRDDWRRDNVNRLIRRLNTEIHATKPWVKFSVSPFGLYRPGFDQFSQIYCDPIKWLQEGWIDILQPQLYWKIDPPAQSYPVLLDWWISSSQNPRVIPVLAGNYLSRVDFDNWPLDEIQRQVEISRDPENRIRGSVGNVMFSAKMFRDNIEGTTDFFSTYIYPHRALQPIFKSLAINPSSEPFAAPKIHFTGRGQLQVDLNDKIESQQIHQIAVYIMGDSGWSLFMIVPIQTEATSITLELERGRYAASYVDRIGSESLK